MVLAILLLLSVALLAATLPAVRDHLPSWAATPQPQAVVAWCGAGLLTASAALSLPSYGMFVLPFAVLAVVFAARRFSFGRGALGLSVSAGLALIAVGLTNLGYRSLPASGVVSLAPGQTSVTYTYGGSDPRPWFVAGSILVVASLAIVWLLGRRRLRKPAVR